MAQWPKHPWRMAGAASLLVVPLFAVSIEIAKDDPSVSASELLPKADSSLLLDVARTSDGYVAVGERGHILISADGNQWQQMPVPTRSTLTTVSAQGSQVWAGGHDGVIVHSSDGGRTWKRQRANPWSADSQKITNGAPIIDTLFVSENEGFAIGAYSLLLKTTDGGTTWNQIQISGGAAEDSSDDMTASDSGVFSDDDLALGMESDPHLNAIARTQSGALVVLGERGAAFRSIDDGASWVKVRLPYAGSMFGLVSLGEERLLAYGLRGNVYQTDDAGSTWQKIESNTETSLMGGFQDDSGTVVLVGGNGTVLLRPAGKSEFSTHHVQMDSGQSPGLSAAIARSGDYLMTSDLGTLTRSVQ